MSDTYATGALKHHPDWPTNLGVAQRTIFHDEDATGCTSWMSISPSAGARYLTDAQVADWVDLPVVVAPVVAPVAPPVAPAAT